MSLALDTIWKTHFENTVKSVNNYPPTDLYELNGTIYVEVALAGFKKEDLEVSLDSRKLLITSKSRPVNEEEKQFIHRGISKKQFTRTVLFNADYIIKSCSFVDGILAIALELDNSRTARLVPIN